MAAKSFGVYCPHCGTRMKTNDLERIGVTLVTCKAICLNCFFSAKAHMEIAYQIQPSINPSPEIEGQIQPLPKRKNATNKQTKQTSTATSAEPIA